MTLAWHRANIRKLDLYQPAIRPVVALASSNGVFCPLFPLFEHKKQRQKIPAIWSLAGAGLTPGTGDSYW
jgi:hypothetical protein